MIPYTIPWFYQYDSENFLILKKVRLTSENHPKYITAEKCSLTILTNETFTDSDLISLRLGFEEIFCLFFILEISSES
jgi:hypothetical protein